MTRPREDIGARAFLEELARVQYANAIAHAPDDREVVADEEHGHAEFIAQLYDEIEHFGFDGGIEPGGRLVENQQLGIARERHRDDDALLHPARELMWIALHHPFRRRDAHAPEHLGGAGEGVAGGP